MLLFILCFLAAAFQNASADITDFAIVRSEVIHDTSQALNPSALKTPAGDLICCYGETGDARPGGHLRFVRSLDNGQTWNQTPYLTMTSVNGQWGSLGGYLSMAPNGNVILAAMDVLAVGDFSNYTSTIKIFTSTDNGQTFSSSPVIVPTDAADLASLSVPIIILANGDWLLPGYIVNKQPPYDVPCGFWRSTDGGATWGTIETAFMDPLPGQTARKYFNEVSIVQRADNSLLAVARTDQDSSGFAYSNGQLYYCESFDNGHTWTVPQLLGIPGHSPALISWYDGTIMLGCRRLSAAGNYTSVYLSSDGVNFQFAFNAVEPRSNRTSGTGYPTFTQLTPNDIYMSFYAGDSTLSWTEKVYCAGNLIHYDNIVQCGTFGYLTADLNNDCSVDLKDFAIIAQSWMFSTDPSKSNYIDCSSSADPRCN
jgi:hypothetical protein